MVGVGDELDVEDGLSHHVADDDPERAEPPEAGDLGSRHHRDGQFRDLLAAELDPHSRVLALGHQIAGLRAHFRECAVEAFADVDGHLLHFRACLVGELADFFRRAIGEVAPLASVGAFLRRLLRRFLRLAHDLLAAAGLRLGHRRKTSPFG